jgi:hypothetical protein
MLSIGCYLNPPHLQTYSPILFSPETGFTSELEPLTDKSRPKIRFCIATVFRQGYVCTEI